MHAQVEGPTVKISFSSIYSQIESFFVSTFPPPPNPHTPLDAHHSSPFALLLTITVDYGDFSARGQRSRSCPITDTIFSLTVDSLIAYVQSDEARSFNVAKVVLLHISFGGIAVPFLSRSRKNMIIRVDLRQPTPTMTSTTRGPNKAREETLEMTLVIKTLDFAHEYVRMKSACGD